MPTSSKSAEIIPLLPKTPRPGMIEDFAMADQNPFGGNLIIYHRVPYEEIPDIHQIMTPEDWDRRDRNTRRCWGAECRCTFCGETWVSGWGTGGDVIAIQGEDGQIFTGVPEKDSTNAVRYEEGCMMLCPCCFAQGTLVRKAHIRDRKSVV